MAPPKSKCGRLIAARPSADRILFAIDWPFVPNTLGTEWIPHIPLCEEDKVKLLSGNAKRLLRL